MHREAGPFEAAASSWNSLVPREAGPGPVETYLNIYDAMKAMQEVLWDEPDWWQDVWVEPFYFVVEEPSAA